MSDMLDIGAAATQASSSLPTALPSLGLTMEVLGPTCLVSVTKTRVSSSSGMQEFKKQLKSPSVAPPCLCLHTSLTNSTQAHWSLLHSLPRALAKALNSALVFLTALILGILPFLRPGLRLPTTFSPFPLPAPLHTALLPPACQPPSLRRKEMGWGPHHPNSLVIPAHSQWGS